jgi:hypothetical protein
MTKKRTMCHETKSGQTRGLPKHEPFLTKYCKTRASCQYHPKANSCRCVPSPFSHTNKRETATKQDNPNTKHSIIRRKFVTALHFRRDCVYK